MEMNIEKCTSKGKSAAEASYNLLAIVDAIQAVTMELREARRKLSMQIIRTMNLVDSRMSEAKEFKKIKKQNIQRRLQAVKQQVQAQRSQDPNMLHVWVLI